jgi:hypothetical protein
LVNVTGRPVFVSVDGKLVRLAEAPVPRAVEMTAKAPASPLVVRVGGHEAVPGDAVLEEVTLEEVAVVAPLVLAPPVTEGVLWLVTAEVLAQFPHRADFVRPVAYRLVDDVEVAGLLGDEEIAGLPLALISVTRTPLVAAADAASLHDLVWDEPDEDAHEGDEKVSDGDGDAVSDAGTD